MAGRADEHPLHQTLDSLTRPASSDRAWFERSTLIGYHARTAESGDHARAAESGHIARAAESGHIARAAESGHIARAAESGHIARAAESGHADGSFVFGATVAIHPGRDVVDAAFAVVTDGRRAVVRASGRLDPFERRLAVGPVTLDAIEPLHTLELSVTDPDGALGINASLTFTARTVAIDLPALGPEHTDPGGLDRRAPRVTPLAHRLVQAGDFRGTIRVDGVTHTIDPADHHAVRTRSWGFGPELVLPGDAPHHALPQTWSLDALIRTGGRAWHTSIDERSDGRRRRSSTHGMTVIDPVVLDPSAGAHPLVDTGGLVDTLGETVHRSHYRPGSRHLDHAELALQPWQADPIRLTITTTAVLPGRDLGLHHPVWDSGTWHGETVVASERSTIDALDPTSVHDLLAFHVVRAESETGTSGTGIVELLALGPHEPSGLQGFTDGGQ